MRAPFQSLEAHKENVPADVYASAEALLSEALSGPCATHDPSIVSRWTLEVHSVEFRCPPGESPHIMDLIVEQTAYEEFFGRLEDLSDEEKAYHETFMMGNPADGAVVLVGVPGRWWLVDPLVTMSNEGLLFDMTSGNDACPSLGAELMDGKTLQVFIGHPHPDHPTRQDGCDPRFAVYVYDAARELAGETGPVWEGEGETEAGSQVRRMIRKHGGPRRQLKAVKA